MPATTFPSAKPAAYRRDGYDWREAGAAVNVYAHYEVSVAGWVLVARPRRSLRGPGPRGGPRAPRSRRCRKIL
jgi:hypothetical protein